MPLNESTAIHSNLTSKQRQQALADIFGPRTTSDDLERLRDRLNNGGERHVTTEAEQATTATKLGAGR